MSSWWLSAVQMAGYACISPLCLGSVQWLEARMQGRRGADAWQPYRDLGKLMRKRPSVPSTASGLFMLAPPVVFTCSLLLGLALPTAFVPPGAGMDLLLVVGLLGLAKFALALAAFDAGSPFGPMSSGRQWFLHVLVEPAVMVAIYVFALSRATTNLPLIAVGAPGLDSLLREPTVPLTICALGYVLLAEVGRLPVDNPGTHLELTMVEEGVELEFSGRALGLVRWAGAMRLTFGLSLVVFLTSPPGRAGFGEPLRMVEGLAGYLIKLAALALVLACWEITRVKVRLRAMVTPLLIGIGVLLFCVVTLVVGYVEQGG